MNGMTIVASNATSIVKIEIQIRTSHSLTRGLHSLLPGFATATDSSTVSV
jgi:hypothetical protein